MPSLFAIPQVNMLAREYCDMTKPKIKFKPVILSHHMLAGLKEGQAKMSKSDPGTHSRMRPNTLFTVVVVMMLLFTSASASLRQTVFFQCSRPLHSNPRGRKREL